MWIIPKNLPIFRYVQDMGGLILDSQELSDQLGQSVLWRSKVSQSKTWFRRLKKDYSLQLLYSQTLKSSLGNSFIEKWISSVGASLVSHLATQEESKEIKILGIYGHTSQKELNSWEDLPLFSSRTFQESFQANSKETTGQIKRGLQFCFMSSESWKDWVTKQRRAHSQRLKLARHTKGKECSFLVSEMNSNKAELISSMDSLNQINQTEIQHGQHQEDKDRTGTSHQELRWATPCTMDHLTPKSQETLMRQATTIRKGRKAPSNLREQVDPVAMEVYEQANWATPMAGTKNHMGGSIDYYIRRQNVGKQVDLNGQMMLKGYQGKLNPRWVEMLMGLPIGWTMPSCTNPVTIEPMSLECLGMELCQIRPQEHLESFGENWSTPPSSQRGETLYPFLSRMKSRYERGFVDFFAPTLQIQVQAAELGINIQDELNKIKEKTK